MVIIDANAQTASTFQHGENQKGVATLKIAQEPRSCLDMLLKSLLVPDRAEMAVFVLNELSFHKAENKMALEEFAETDGCKYVVQAMENVLDSVEMQWRCCKLLMNLTFSNDKNKVSFSDSGATKAIVEAMNKYPEDKSMQRYGCGALRNLSLAQQHRIVDVGGTQCILNSMKNFPDDEYVQEHACPTLQNLAAADVSFKELIIEQGGAILLTEAQLRYRGKNDRVAQFAAQALTRLYGM